MIIPILRSTEVKCIHHLFSYHTFMGNQKEIDTSLAYKNTVLIQKEAVHFIEDSIAHNESFYSYYLMQFYMTECRLGYLKNSSDPQFEFKSISDADILIFCSNEKDPVYQNLSSNGSYGIIKRFEKKEAWVEIYRRIPKFVSEESPLIKRTCYSY
jgi:hypothetical protein